MASIRWLALGDATIFPALVQSTFEAAELAFELALGLTGMLCLWLGIMKIGERAGIVAVLTRLTGPFFARIFPEVPRNHPVLGPVLMNFSMNILGMDNAATPMGLKAMEGLQELNPQKDTASNAQIMFLVLNTSGLTLIPIFVILYRTEMGAADPTDIFIPVMLATFCSTLVGLLVVAALQRIKIWDRVVLAYLLGLAGLMALIVWGVLTLPKDQVASLSSATSNFLIFAIIAGFISMGVIKRINVYEAFIDGAKEGFSVAIKIIPYLVAMLVAIAVFRNCGALDYLVQGLSQGVAWLGIDTRFVQGLPTALMKPLSGSGARAMMLDTMQACGADSFAGRLSSIMQGSTETTFYVLALYFGAVNIKRSRYAVGAGLAADIAGIIAAILLAYLFFGQVQGCLPPAPAP